MVCGVVTLLAGALIAVRGGRWQGMSARYERTTATAGEPAPPTTGPTAPDRPDATDGTTGKVTDDAEDRGRAAATMWSALDRGEDPTAR